MNGEGVPANYHMQRVGGDPDLLVGLGDPGGGSLGFTDDCVREVVSERSAAEANAYYTIIIYGDPGGGIFHGQTEGIAFNGDVGDVTGGNDGIGRGWRIGGQGQKRQKEGWQDRDQTEKHKQKFSM